MKQILIIVIIALVGFGIWKVVTTKAPETLPAVDIQETSTTTTVVIPVTTDTAGVTQVDSAKSTFSFTGYGPGKEETGTFNKITYSLTTAGGMITGGNVVFDNASLSTTLTDVKKKAQLEGHLCSDDFIDCVKYPTTKFTLSSLETKNGVLTATGVLSFRGVEKTISFPVTLKDKTYSAEIRLDVSPFNFKYTGIKNEVSIKFSVVLK
jgi:polyisoprenoid-binding protein YceI